MMIYLDSSWWVSLKVEGDRNHSKAAAILQKYLQKADFIWTDLQQIEVYNTFRQLEYQGVIGLGDSHKAIDRLENEIKEAFWVRQNLDWKQLVTYYEKNSFLYGVKQRMRAMDLMHISAAISIRADAFFSYDVDQLKAAKRMGLEILT